MKKKLLLAAFALGFVVNAQFTTPNTGVNWTLADVVANAPEVMTFEEGVYTLHEDLLVEKNDTLLIHESLTLKIAENVLLDINGYFEANADEITITAVDTEAPYRGIRFDSDSYGGYIKNTLIEYGGGIRVLSDYFEIHNSEVSNNAKGVSSGGAISFSNGSPVIMNSTFKFNQGPALGTAANSVCPALIQDNYFEGNNQSNDNRPQINMGPSGADTIRIIGNTVIGDRSLTKVGGISASSLVGIENRVLIKDNIIRDNRYGLTSTGNSTGIIDGNIIEDNNTENLPMMGGSGINLYGTKLFYISNNQIRRNLWGVTLQTTAMANLGSDDEEDFNEGKNIFSDNENGGQVYALFNNTPNAVKALHNCWIEEDSEFTYEDAENVISHQFDDPELGLVTFDPFGCEEEEELGVVETTKNAFVIYPNPSQNIFFVNTTENAELKMYDLNGRLVLEQKLSNGKNSVQNQLSKGIYIVEVRGAQSQSTQKMVIQ